MAEAILQVRGLNKSFGGVKATDNVELEVRAGEIHAVIGPNGAGKTTLISQLSGALKPDSGSIAFGGRDITNEAPFRRSHRGLARSFQITSVFMDMTVQDNVALAVQSRLGHSFRFWARARYDEDMQGAARGYLGRVGLIDRAADLASNMSHGERRQLEIAMALATEPRLFLLDEPMAGMGSDESSRMVEIIKGLKSDRSVLLVEHDMDAVFALADRISVLVYGRVIATGAPNEIRADEHVKRAYLGEDAV